MAKKQINTTGTVKSFTREQDGLKLNLDGGLKVPKRYQKTLDVLVQNQAEVSIRIEPTQGDLFEGAQ